MGTSLFKTKFMNLQDTKPAKITRNRSIEILMQLGIERIGNQGEWGMRTGEAGITHLCKANIIKKLGVTKPAFL